MDKYTEKKMDSECPRDSKKKHRFEVLGVTLSGYDCSVFKILQCSQCKKIVKEELEEIPDI